MSCSALFHVYQSCCEVCLQLVVRSSCEACNESCDEKVGRTRTATRSVRTLSKMLSRVYLPADFWGVAFTTKGSALPKIMLRSIVFTAPAILAVLVRRDGYLGDGIGPTDEDSLTRFTLPEVPGRLITPFALLVALLTSYRLNHAHGKWEVANGSVMVIQETSRLLISRLCAIFPATALNKERLLRFRRLMVLGCVSIYKHVHSIKDFDAELQRNLLTREELALFSRTSTISYEEGHNKSDKFPTKNRRASPDSDPHSDY